jgi:hypothetical protein
MARLPGQLRRQHIKEEHLSGESLGRRDGSFLAAVRQQSFIHDPSHRRSRLISNADCVSAGSSRALEHTIDVFTFA